MTDPATTPKSPLGKVLFGLLYGIGVFALFGLREQFGAPTFYDKLLCVPFLNLSVRFLDRLTAVERFRPGSLPASLRGSRKLNLAIMGVWVPLFAVLMATDFLGKDHEGRTYPFWQQACADDLPDACRRMKTMPFAYCRPGFESECQDLCDQGSGTACFLYGSLIQAADAGEADWAFALETFARACTLGNAPACLEIGERDKAIALLDPSCESGVADDCLQLGRMYSVGTDVGGDLVMATIHFSRACRRGSGEGCRLEGSNYLRGDEVPRIPDRAAEAFGLGCDLGDAPSCSGLGRMHYRGDGVPVNRERGIALLEKACELGLEDACRWRAELPDEAL